MARLDKNYGNIEFDNLVNRGGDVGHIEIQAGQDILKRGSVIASDGNLMDTGKTPAYILAEDVNTAGGAVTGVVYKNGNFVKQSLIVKEAYTLSSDDIETLRGVGIIVEEAM